MTSGSKRSFQTLLRLLEAKTLRYSRSSLDYLDAGNALVDAGFLVEDGHRVATTADDDDGEPVQVVFDERRNQHGYYSPAQGWVRVDTTSLAMYRPNIGATIHHLLGKHILLPRDGPIERVPDLAWEIGQIPSLRTAATTAWFARRLNDPFTQRDLRKAMEARPAPTRRLLLTTTAKVDPDFSLPRTVIVPICDVLSAHLSDVIDLSILRARFEATELAPISNPVHLSDDGKTLTLNYDHRIVFTGKVQQAVIRKLVGAHRLGQGVNAADLLKSAGSGALQFSQVFKSQWPMLKPYLHSSDGLWSFKI